MTEDRSLEDALLLQDVGVLVGALWASHLLRESLAEVVPILKPTVTLSEYAPLLLIFVPAWAIGAERRDLARLRTLRGSVLDVAIALLWTQAWGAVALSVILVAAQAPLNRSLIAIFLGVSTMALFAVLLAQRSYVRRRRGRALALLVGDVSDEQAREIEALRDCAIERLAATDALELRARLWEGGVDEVVLPAANANLLHEMLSACEEIGVPGYVAVEQAELEIAEPEVEALGKTLYLRYDRRPPDRFGMLVKLIFDRVAALVLLALLAPLLLVIALAVKLASPGPVLFVQERGGLNGRPFRMYKFRTMREGAEEARETLLARNEMDGPVFKISEDPRVNRLGRLLRRTSMDELPQLVNVLLGHMSLVGPRPLPLLETRGLVGPHRRRLSVRPGITCIWQVSGRNELSFEQWMALDLQYVDGWSLGLDLAVLLRTVPALLTGRGAR